MKLTKKQENEIWQVYDTWLYSYLNGDVKTYKKYLDKDYHFIGSTDNEEFLNKKDTTDFFKATADQLAGKCDLRNENKIIEKFEGLVIVTHLFDAWFKNDDDYTYYGRFRFTNVLKENKDGWRFIYQHFSTTDSKTDEGETIGFDKVNIENQELREAIKRRTFELEQKNRELEVETALERIRAQAVAMKQSTDLLDIVVTMRNEFIKLGHEAHYFWHMMWLPEAYEKAMTSGDGSKIGFVMTLPRHIHGDIPQLAKWEKSKKPTVVHAMNVDEALDYVHKMVTLGDFQNIDPQAPTEDDIKHIGGLTFIMARTTHGEIGYSLPGVVKNPPKEDIDILVRFAGAFDLAHQRFLDLQKAEKQARETQIELSLERIRSRVTAMQESNELFDIVVTMRNEFLSLGHDADYFWHMKWTKDNYEMSMTAEDGGRLGMVITVPKFVHEQIENLHAWENSNSPYFVLALNGKDAWDYIEKMNTYGKYQQIDPHAPTEEDILNIGGLTFIIARTTHGEIGFSLAGKIDNPPQASVELLVRFASVFDLAYKRFEDLQNSETQTRETQIELALEKVRSRTMAMQHSDELQEASFLLDEQVRALGIKTWGCAFNIYGENESTEWFGNESGVLPKYTVPRKGIFKKYYDKGQKGESLFTQEFSGKVCVDHYEYMSSLPVIGDVLKDLKKTNKGFPTYQIDHVVYFKYGYLLFITTEHVPESHDVFKRFAKVFEQTYRRFLDLQKAEAQAREAQIEAALERVRAASMAMHKTEDLYEVVIVYFEQLKLLEIEFIQSWITIFNLDKGFVDVWFSPLEGIYKDPKHFKMPSTLFEDTSIKSWKEGLPFSNISFKTKAEVDGFMQVCDDVTNTNYFGKTQKKLKLERFEMLDANHKYGCISKSNIVEATTDEKDILQRFATVFEQTYTRFLDLQKSENQAREAQIEVAMERIRSRSLAMHTSEELMDVITELRRQIDGLGQLDLEASVIHLYTDGEPMFESIAAVRPPGESGEIVLANVFFPVDATNQIKHMLKMYASDETEYTIEFDKKMAEEWQKTMMKYAPEIATRREGFVENRRISEHSEYWNFADFSDGSLLLVTHSPASEDTKEVLRKAAQVFDLAYRRFKDLKKAEAQAKEAQIEAALERVRASAMAMHKSDDLTTAVDTVFSELKQLGFNTLRCGIGIFNDNSNKVNVWSISSDSKDEKASLSGDEKLEGHPLLDKIYEAWTNQVDFSYTLKGKDLDNYYKVVSDSNFPISGPEKNELTTQYYHAVVFPAGGLYAFNATEFTVDKKLLMKRFGEVFHLSFTRHLDLKQAETQAREAQIEAALERIRSRSMAMHQSVELLDVITVVSEQLVALGFRFSHVSFVNNNIDDTYRFWTSAKGRKKPMRFVVPNINIAMFNNITAAQKRAVSFFTDILTQKEHKEWHEHLLKNDERAKIFSKEDNKYIMSMGMARSIAINPNIMLILANYASIPYSEEENKIIERFGQVFEQSYTRFLDLKRAEAQARESQIETALEKVRSRTMAMQHSDELPEAANNLFLQVQALGIPVWSAGYNILSRDKSYCTCFMSSEGEIQEGFKLPLNEHASLIPWFNALNSEKEFFVYGQEGEDLVAHYDYMKSLPDLKDTFKQLDKAGIELPTIQFNHLVRFNEGFLLFITYQAVPEVHDIFKRFGKVFEQTYTRFLDLKKAEAQSNLIKKEKERLEVTLSELKATQSQLIQSEKMASLGELTAGIAHEIQNPLNFVNNFSEVSKELLDEMIEELENGDMEEVKAITDDVIQNLEKINHHGKRADGIVKGMLQHSRASGDKKEATNINNLADEYMRLAYHGLRAKDKSFNATLETNFDEKIKSINIIPQDIGRVILNLFTNAFYAVDEKKKEEANANYAPTVTVSTKLIKNNVEISVRDNGNGIPKKVLDKIFQPFFTTKPTGQGTGLGLSMSYDIVTKGHGGKLLVETKQDNGTEFIIKLPITK